MDEGSELHVAIVYVQKFNRDRYERHLLGVSSQVVFLTPNNILVSQVGHPTLSYVVPFS